MKRKMVKKTTTDAKKERLPKGTKVVSTKESAEKAYKEQVKRVVKTQKIKLSNGTVNVYNANYSEIDECLDEIRKECRKNGLNDYACNNIQNILNETLQRVKLAGN